MVQYAINTIQGASMSFFGISQALQKELEKTFSEEMCNVLIKLVEEIYATSDIRFQKIFEEKQEFLVLSISERLREVFATKSELQAEFAKVRQEMAEMKLELKQDIAKVMQEIAEVRTEIAEVRTEIAEVKGNFKILQKEVRYAAIGIIALMILLQPKVFDFITHIFK